MSLSMGGNPRAAVKDLLLHGEATLNAKLIETAHLVLNRYTEKIVDAGALNLAVQALRTRFSTLNSKPSLGEQKRQAGGLTLRNNNSVSVKALSV